MTAMSLYNLIDAYYIGRWCGSASIAGLALIFPIMNLMIAVAMMVGLGCAANISLALGRGDRDFAFRVLGHGLILGSVFGAILGGLTYFFLPHVLYFFGARDATYQPAYDFMSVTALGFPISAVFMNLNHMMRASGYPKKAMYCLLISVIANILLAPIFIYTLDMGMSGAALATLLAQLLGLVCVLRHFFSKTAVLYLKRGIFVFSSAMARRICLVGLPPCMVNICGCVVVLYFNHLFLSYEGDMGVGAFGIVNRVMFFFGMVVMGIAQGMQPIVGYNYGVGAYSRARATLFRAMGAATGIMVLGFALVMIFPYEIMGLFVKEGDSMGEAMMAIGGRGMRIMLMFMPIIGFQMIVGNFFQALGKPVISIFLNLMRQMIVLIPLLSILPQYYGVTGIWLSAAVSDIISACVSATTISIFLKRYYNKSDKIISQTP